MPRNPLQRIETLKLSPMERLLAKYYAERLGRYQPNQTVKDWLYRGTAGGAESNSVEVHVSMMKKKLPAVGLTIEAPANSSTRRMMWLT